jgi:hypothetical protein
MQVYTALRQRTTLGLKLHVLSNGTGDAAELVARLGPNGRFEIGYTLIAELAAEVTRLKESHHFYPIVFYFRFREPFYSVSNAAQLALEAIALIKTALNDDEYSWLKQSSRFGTGQIGENPGAAARRDIPARPSPGRRSV